MTDILITGATGFVGSHLIEALSERGATARALVRETSDVSLLERHGIVRVIGDLSDREALTRAVADAEVVLHVAAATRALGAAAFHDVNEGGTRRLLDAMEAGGGGRRLVYLSSLAAVGPARGRPVRPGDEPRPITAYGRSKLAGEREALARAAIRTTVLRPPAVYGPRDRDLLTFFRAARRGVLPVLGSPDRRLQMIHAADLARAIIRAAESPEAAGVFHVAEPVVYRWDEVLDRMGAAVGRDGVRIPVPATVLKGAAAISEAVARLRGRPAIFDRDKALELLADDWVCETDAARQALRFEASIPLAEGLAETAGWYRAHGWL